MHAHIVQRFRIVGFSLLVSVIAWNVILLFPTCLTAGTRTPLDKQIEALLMKFKGAVGIYAKDLKRNRIYQYHATEMFPTASVFKVPVMIESFAACPQERSSSMNGEESRAEFRSMAAAS